MFTAVNIQNINQKGYVTVIVILSLLMIITNNLKSKTDFIGLFILETETIFFCVKTYLHSNFPHHLIRSL